MACCTFKLTKIDIHTLQSHSLVFLCLKTLNVIQNKIIILVHYTSYNVLIKRAGFQMQKMGIILENSRHFEHLIDVHILRDTNKRFIVEKDYLTELKETQSANEY